MIITLTSMRRARAINRALETFGRYKNKKGFYSNSYNSHFKGRVGEEATDQLLDDLGAPHENLFLQDDQEAECDILLTAKELAVRLEIKTWSREHWGTLGRCFAVGQAKKLQKSVDIVIWLVSDLPKIKDEQAAEKLKSIQVEVMGFSTVADIIAAPVRLTSPPFGRAVQNHQLDITDLRPLAELMSALA